MKPLTYLACPYSHEDARVREARFHSANRAAVDLLRHGHVVFSPISHSHPIASAGGLPRDWAFWERFDRAYLEMSRWLVVLTIEGWMLSTGVRAEIQIAGELGVKVAYLSPDESAAKIPALPL